MRKKRTALNRIREEGGVGLWLFTAVFLVFSVTLALFFGFVAGFWFFAVLDLTS